MFNSHSCCRSGLQLSAFSAFGGRSGYFVHFRPKLLSQTKTPLFCSLEAQFLFPLTLLYSNGTTERPPARSLGYSLSPYHRAGTHSLTDRHSASDRHAVPHPERVDVGCGKSVSHYHTPSREHMARTITLLTRVRVRRVSPDQSKYRVAGDV